MAALLLAAPLVLSESPGPEPPAPTVMLRAAFAAEGGIRVVEHLGPLAIVLAPGTKARVRVAGREPTDPDWQLESRTVSLELPGGEVRAADGELVTSVPAPSTPGTVRARARVVSLWRSAGALGPDLALRRETTAEQDLWLCVPVPWTEHAGEYLRGYRVGDYSELPETPASFVEVPAEAREAHLSPHLRLEQFLSRDPAPQVSPWPRYAPIPYALVDKVEALSAELRRREIVGASITVFSGYRTPHYNKTIHGASQSQHLVGKAMDFWVDSDSDGRFDDVDGNGAVDIRDAIRIGKILRSLEDSGAVAMGGTGVYETHAGPITSVNMHLDIRGDRASWGRSYPNPTTQKYDAVTW